MNVSGDQVENNFSNPTYHTRQHAVEVKSEPAEETTTQVRTSERLSSVLSITHASSESLHG